MIVRFQTLLSNLCRYIKVEPAASFAYSYKIVSDHASGTHW